MQYYILPTNQDIQHHPDKNPNIKNEYDADRLYSVPSIKIKTAELHLKDLSKNDKEYNKIIQIINKERNKK